jgi:flagellar biosynthesis/type III secretory pathway protein FliH
MSATISISTAIELEFDKIYTEIKFENINLTRALRLILENAEVRCTAAASSPYTTEAELQYQNGFEDGYVDGHFDGREEAYDEGYELGYSEKCQDKHEEGFTDGYDQGHMDGHLEGRDEGYKEGFEDRKEAK